MGNYSREDDGIGLHITEYISDNGLDDGFEVIEVANDGMKVLTFFTEDTEKMLVVDCALMDREPGDYALFGVDEVDTRKVTGKISTHEGDILKLIALAKECGYPVPEIRILAIEPGSLGMTMDLSDSLQKRLAEYVDIAVKEILR